LQRRDRPSLSGINVLILWHTLAERGFGSQRWITYRQAQDLGGYVRKGERGTTVFYADRFTPKSNDGVQLPLEGEEQRQVAFLKRFTVFNLEQCEGVSRPIAAEPSQALPERELIPQAEALIAATGADFRIGGDEAFYVPSQDYIQVPPQQAYRDQINWYRTALHELGHWTAHTSRLGRLESEDLKGLPYDRADASGIEVASPSVRRIVLPPSERRMIHVREPPARRRSARFEACVSRMLRSPLAGSSMVRTSKSARSKRSALRMAGTP